MRNTSIQVGPSVCGNGDLQPGEVCDDGNTSASDGCRADCLGNEVCGDDLLDTITGEVCDDGNTTGGDGCSANCLSDETCGNNILDAAAGEVCDDGNTDSGDGCRADCLGTEVCGDGLLDLETDEVCDDGNTAAGDGCRADCRGTESCGDGLLDPITGEECDSGPDNSNSASGACRGNCKVPYCGDGIADVSEVTGVTLEWLARSCDISDNLVIEINSVEFFDVAMDASVDCWCYPSLGVQSATVNDPVLLGNLANGINAVYAYTQNMYYLTDLAYAILSIETNTGTTEQILYDGNNPSSASARSNNVCEFDTTWYITQSFDVSLSLLNEVCDDGNTVDADGCSADCSSDESCGNGIIDYTVDEYCDDGPNNGTCGYCSTSCDWPFDFCGNGDIECSEVCDDGNTAAGDGCREDCLGTEVCGDTFTDTAAGEACDDGNTVDGDGCSADCLSDESCGNGIIDGAAGEVCDDGNTTAGDGCREDCLGLEVCGDMLIDNATGEVCDDGNTIDGDGCSADCLSDETCGNGILDLPIGEECDDGNTATGDGCSTACLDETDACIPATIGHVGGPASGIEVLGNLAFVALGYGGMEIYDIAAPSAPIRLARIRTSRRFIDFAASGTTLLALTSGNASSDTRVTAYDISAPSAPVELGSVYIGDTAYGIDWNGGGTAVVANESSGVAIVDASSPAGLSLVTKYNTAGTARGLQLVGGTAYVADDFNGLVVLDLTTPSSPAPLGAYDTTGIARDVAVSGSTAYIADDTNGLVILDVTNPGSIALQAEYDYIASPLATEVAVNGTTIYVSQSNGGITSNFTGVYVVDASAGSPSTVGNYATGSEVQDVSAGTDRLYVSSEAEGLHMVDTTVFSSPALLGRTYTLLPESVTLDGSLAYVAGGLGGMSVVDVSDPSMPVILAQYRYPSGGWLEQIALDGTLAYLAYGNSHLVTLDVSTPSAPTLVSQYRPGGSMGTVNTVAASGTTVFVGGNPLNNFASVDMSAPATPSTLQVLQTGYFLQNLLVDGAYLYQAADTGHLRIYDVTNPSAMTEIAAAGSGAWTRSLAKDASFVYFTGLDTNLQIYTISDPANPSFVGFYVPSGNSDVMALSGDYVYLENFPYFEVVDVSDRTSPTFVSNHSASNVDHLATGGGYLYVSDQSRGMTIWEDLPGLCTPRCGNNTVEYPEVCDDGNLTDGDGCAADCMNF